MAVEHGVDFFSGREIGDGEHVITDLGHAHGAAFRRDGIDGVAGIGLAGGGVGVEPRVEALASELAHQDQRIGDGAIWAFRVVYAMDSDGGLVEIAFPVDARSVDKLLVFGHALGRLQVLVKEGANRLEIDVEDAFGLGEQAGGFRRSLGAEEDGHGQSEQDRGHYPKRSAGSSVHEGPSGIP